MTGFLESLGLSQILTPDRLVSLLKAVLTLIIGVLLARLASSAAAKVIKGRMSLHEAVIVRRLVFYILTGLVLATALHQLGFQLGVLLGAAGILTVAIGFASQTSASNLISGLFLIAERPFAVGDLVMVENTTGIVQSIDLLSVKLRTFDNLFVRVPNEHIIKSIVTNVTRFPIRRVDIEVGIAYKENVEKVRGILFGVADRNPLCLDDPKPILIFMGYGDSALEFKFCVWGASGNFLDLMNSIKEEIKVAFDDQGIEIPFPHRTLYTGSVTEPFPVRVVEESKS
ncbi:MAG: mechanosensitive ion channel family protein [Candidatus Eisenbacteria bacterium]|uniref:Mechanosensitive ion channel family protein n=1 Tax=Eiseniibacteriota bacterium TaxID=2212470 RepID=A0A948RVA5_UNCEI|nr:mechanosensitive ion channel family protein [Candidatus Eisenbacteria bacterium]MBU1949073.1 mechanosensitive ion channel family protein [Candidatus Eisenbacteria bacterium]MBU2691176.1 mechanosensitive ion channel family protein [Candidatus Eisenbacteria bacterium]